MERNMDNPANLHTRRHCQSQHATKPLAVLSCALPTDQNSARLWSHYHHIRPQRLEASPQGSLSNSSTNLCPPQSIPLRPRAPPPPYRKHQILGAHSHGRATNTHSTASPTPQPSPPGPRATYIRSTPKTLPTPATAASIGHPSAKLATTS